MKAEVRLAGQALEEYNKLCVVAEQETTNSENRVLLDSIKQKVEWLKEDPLKGEVIKKKDIPRELDVDNLFKLRIAKFWRMLYTIRRDEIKIICFILVIEPHKHYNKRFGFKKR